MADADFTELRLKLTREFGGLRGQFEAIRKRWWFKVLAGLALAGLLFIFLVWLFIARDLPSVDKLRTYEPPLPTIVRGVDGNPIHSYARERRVQLNYDEYPPLLIRAFLSAE